MEKRCVRLVVAFGLTSTIVAATPASADPIVVANATPVLDQSFEGPSRLDFLGLNVSGAFAWAQTFTVGISGELAAIHVLVSASPDATAPLLFDLRQTHSGVPATGNLDVLASVVVPRATVSSSHAFVTVDLSALDVPVTVGDRLAIVLQSPGPGIHYEWAGDGTCPVCGDPTYARGELFFRLSETDAWRSEPGDAGFRTFVRVGDVAATPEPATFLLLAAGIVGASLRNRRMPR
jgi:hypothetical protein